MVDTNSASPMYPNQPGAQPNSSYQGNQWGTPAPYGQPGFPPAPKPKPRWPWFAGAGVVAVVVVVGIVVGVKGSGSSGSASAAASASPSVAATAAPAAKTYQSLPASCDLVDAATLTQQGIDPSSCRDLLNAAPIGPPGEQMITRTPNFQGSGGSEAQLSLHVVLNGGPEDKSDDQAAFSTTHTNTTATDLAGVGDSAFVVSGVLDMGTPLPDAEAVINRGNVSITVDSTAYPSVADAQNAATAIAKNILAELG